MQRKQQVKLYQKKKATLVYTLLVTLKTLKNILVFPCTPLCVECQNYQRKVNKLN